MENNIPGWMKDLNEEDWQFIKRLLLTSGSLKEVAGQYGISYPTVRIRLDRLIEKVKILDSRKPKTKFHQTLQLLVADGRIDRSAAKKLKRAYEQSTEQEV